jgi:CubicO group peptidase (beta-lactamase class C family)
MSTRFALAVIVSTLHFCQVSLASEPHDAVGQAMMRFADDGTIAGAVTLLAVDGQVRSFETVGLADVESKRPMTKETLFWIASMTKPIVATSLMILVEEGKVALDDPASKYIPEFQNATITGGASPARPVTVRDLITHTSGVGNPKGLTSPTPTLAETVASIASQPLQFEPGSQWKYGNGIVVIGRVIEVASGKPFAQFVAERVLQPLKMNDTTFDPTPAQRERLATIYAREEVSKQFKPVTSAAFANVDPSGPRKMANPTGGLASTAGDYFRFLQMVLNGGELEGTRILSTAAVKQMTSPQTGELAAGFTPGSQWGLGWGIVREPIGATAVLSPGTFGHGGAFGTQAWVDPTRRAIYIMLIQRTGMPNSDGSDVRIAFQAAASELIGKP